MLLFLVSLNLIVVIEPALKVEMLVSVDVLEPVFRCVELVIKRYYALDIRSYSHWGTWSIFALESLVAFTISVIQESLAMQVSSFSSSLNFVN